MTHGAAIFGCDGLTLGADELAFFRAADPFGFILFGRNIDAPDQVRALCDALRDAVGRDAPILIDQEGGRVQRLRGPHWREWQPPLDMISRDSVAAMRLRSRIIAAELRGVGIDANCAPVADIAGDATHPFLRNRCYGTDAATVTALARAAAEGHLEQGVLPVIKHMPGHGRATADSHKDLPTVTADADDLRQTDFAPFRALNHLPMAMTAHIVFRAFDDRPATCSPKMIRLIREEIGFDGLLMTDDISMEALAGTIPERTAAALAAGCDVVLHCNGDLAERTAVADAAGRMGADATRRAKAALAMRHTPESVDMAALDAELSGLVIG
ncbi:beta-N-acetylhexosaminidase [Cereibacter sp. SYSU M97828]|nr:beta-N-acetylhexosaminidase [Cereibacter flavus]